MLGSAVEIFCFKMKNAFKTPNTLKMERLCIICICIRDYKQVKEKCTKVYLRYVNRKDIVTES